MISCHQYDYIEIVCMYRYPIKLTLKNDEVIEGVAADTLRDSARAEYIKVITEAGDTLVGLSELKQLEVTVENPHFLQVDFD